MSTPSPDLAPPGRLRRWAPVSGPDWRRSGHSGTEIDDETGEVVLERQPVSGPPAWATAPAGGAAGCPPAPAPVPAAAPERAGLAFDARGCLYRGVPERGQVQRVPWPDRQPPVDLLEGPAQVTVAPPGRGRFVASGADPRRPLRAWALAADRDDHLFVLDGGTGTVAVLDLADGHLLRTVVLDRLPVDLAVGADGTVLVLTGSRGTPIAHLDAIGAPVGRPLPPGALAGIPPGARPSRLAVAPDGTPWLLLRQDADAWIVSLGTPRPAPLRVSGGTELEIDGAGRVVVAGPPGGDLVTWAAGRDALTPGIPLRARGYDGRGLVRTPDGRIGFSTGTGFRAAVRERVRYGCQGTVDTAALDSRSYRQQWGRVFVEACVPPGTQLAVATAGGDDAPDGAALARARLYPLHRRETGREVPWSPLPPGDRYAVYEAPVRAEPGRFLRLRLRLAGAGTTTPRIRALRAEFPATGLVERLPRAYRTDPGAADFLRRYLALVDGQLGDLESRAVHRDLLLDPWGAPTELLSWLGSLVGLSLDARWPERARRTLLAEAVALFRRRGTPAGLRRVLEIYLGAPVVVLEAFRLRAATAALGGEDGSPAVVGTALRVGGGAEPGDGDPFRSSAHRFTVLLTREVDDAELAVVRDLLEVARPAHTLVEVCTVGQGMRAGIGLHVEISTVVGPGSGVAPLRVGGELTADSVLGRGRAGLRVGAGHAGGGVVVDG
ncbi:phage tail protein [Geodermatophilus sp. SYSU D01176]